MHHLLLYDGIPLKKDIDRLSLNEVPRQESRYELSYKELTLSRANKSIRVFDYVVECLSKRQTTLY